MKTPSFCLLLLTLGFIAESGLLLSGKEVMVKIDDPIPSSPSVIVTQDGGNGGYEAFPDICRLADGRLLILFYDGWGHLSIPDEKHPKGGRISGCYSEDEGKTWSEPTVLLDTPLDDRDPSVVQLADGRLLCNWFTFDPIEGGGSHCVLYLAESTDAGKTWSAPRPLFDRVTCSSPIRVLSNGRLILPTYTQIDDIHSGSVALSDDGGKTWSENIRIPNGEFNLDAETDVIERSDGSLYAIERDAMAYSESIDAGQTWSESKAVGFFGHSPYLIKLKGGAVVLAYRAPNQFCGLTRRIGEGGVLTPNTSLRVSLDECRTWGDPVFVDAFMGGYPSMVELNDGSVLIVYYEEDEGSNLRAKRFRIGENGDVQWLEP